MIYFVQDEMTLNIKIGYSDSPEFRLRQLQTASPGKLRIILTIPGDKDDEKNIHKCLRASNICGEWFKPTSELCILMITEAAIHAACEWVFDNRDGVRFFLAPNPTQSSEELQAEHDAWLAEERRRVKEYVESQDPEWQAAYHSL